MASIFRCTAVSRLCFRLETSCAQEWAHCRRITHGKRSNMVWYPSFNNISEWQLIDIKKFRLRTLSRWHLFSVKLWDSHQNGLLADAKPSGTLPQPQCCVNEDHCR